jgi:hypothetical protein
MGKKNLDLQGGVFKFTKPCSWGSWLMAIIGLLVFFAGIYVALGAVDGEQYAAGLLIIPLGLIIMSFAFPGSFESELMEIRKNSISPEELNSQAEERGLSIDNWFLGQSTLVPTNDPSDWIMAAPGPASWDDDDRYGPDGDGSPLSEHPVNVGTPIPATTTTFSILILLAIITSLYALGEFVAAYQSIMPAVVAIIAGVLITIVGYYNVKLMRQKIDTPTSLIRSIAAGHPELVGQVRPAPEGILRVVVDGHQSMVMDNMVAFNWSYEQYRCRTVQTKDGSREECNWHTVRTDEGGCSFILHDGTGGIRVNPQTFKRKDWGKFRKRWDGAFAKTILQDFKSQAIANLVGGGRVKKHRWTLFGLKLGEPVYLLGNTRQRTNEELQSEGLDGSLQNTLLEMVGDEDAPGIKSNIHRGTELSSLGRMRSGVEMIMLPLLFTIGAIAILGLG